MADAKPAGVKAIPGTEQCEITMIRCPKCNEKHPDNVKHTCKNAKRKS